jgi:hypothetical protein
MHRTTGTAILVAVIEVKAIANLVDQVQTFLPLVIIRLE